jgi:dTDP-4-amino-4,6-dideoxygalactose transaminase
VNENILAVNGAPPVTRERFAAWPIHEEDEIAAAVDVLRSGKGNSWAGSSVSDFEDAFRAWCGAGHAIAVANGTLALDLALRSLGMEPGDEVVVAPRTFIATASSVVLARGKPIFADVDADSGNLTVASIEAVVSARTRGIIVVHVAGWPADMPAIMALAARHNLFVIEDCAQAHGAMIDDQMVGSFGDAATFSFCQDKIMSTGGEGGMLTCQRQDTFEKAWSFKDHGKDFAATHAPDPGLGYRWLHANFGSNYRLTGIQAAIGLAQLRKVGAWGDLRRKNAGTLQAALQKLPGIRAPWPCEPVVHAAYKFHVFLDLEALAADWTRERVISAINAEGVPCFNGSCSEVYVEKAFSNSQFAQKYELPVARQLGLSSLMFLVHPTLTASSLDAVSRAVEKVLAVAIS